MKYLSFIAIVFILSACNHSSTEKADFIYYNATIWTGDSAKYEATAIAVKGNSILFVGSDNEFDKFKDDKTVMTDVAGKMIVPGFIDNHTHFLSGGYNLASVNLRQAKSKQEFIQILKDYCKQYNDDRWILGGDWDHEAWGGELPDKEWIDSITGNHPLFVNRYDGHMAFANSIALKKAGITIKTKTPAGGEIILDEKHEVTGVLKDEAMNLLYNVIPTPTEKELNECLERACKHAFSNGVTQVHDMGSYGGWADLDIYRKAYADKKLDLRIYSFVPLATWQKLDSFCEKNGKGDDMLRWGGLKGFVDGSLGSTTAWFYKPYLDANTTTGLNVTDTLSLKDWVLNADKKGLQIAVHAIGDRANDFILNVYKEAAEKNGERDRRSRIEHAQHLTQDAIKRFALQHVIPCMQPYHAIDDGRWAYKRLDDERLKGTYAFNSLLKTGARLTFGSDWSVAPLKPIEGIYAAVTRITLDNKDNKPWYPEERITVEQALKCYTINNAYAGNQEMKLGQLKTGMLADFVVLSNNLFTISPEKIKEVAVLRTIINGKEVYKK